MKEKKRAAKVAAVFIVVHPVGCIRAWMITSSIHHPPIDLKRKKV